MDQFVKGTPALPKALSHLGSNSYKPPDAPTTLTFSAADEDDQLPFNFRQFLRRWFVLGAAAAAVVAFAAWVIQHPSGSWLSDVPTSRDVQNSNFVATLTQMVDGVWESGAPAFRPGQLLNKGSRIAFEIRNGQSYLRMWRGSRLARPLRFRCPKAR